MDEIQKINNPFERLQFLSLLQPVVPEINRPPGVEFAVGCGAPVL
jgi:hypothetical protein